MSIFKDKLPENQSDDEWWADFDGASKASDATSLPEQSNQRDTKRSLFRYLSHRTTRTGSVVLEFESVDGSIRAVKFFNVKLTSSRGNSYPAKSQGQFNPPEHGKFRQFYLDVVGKAPSRWCRAHKSMRSQFSGLVFSCEYMQAEDAKGQPYFKIVEIKFKKTTL